MAAVNLATRVAEIPHWYHRIELPDGIVTPGVMPIDPSWYRFPEDLSGKSVLDVGAYDGYWTIEACRRGAEFVMAIDDFSDTIYRGERRSWAPFDLAVQACGFQDRVTREECDVYSLAGRNARFDVVICYGVIYHCRHPLLVLDILSLRCKELLLLESAITDDISAYGHPRGDDMVAEFYPADEYGENPTNWWGPTLHCLDAMVLASGFARTERWKVENPGSLPYARGFVRAWK